MTSLYFILVILITVTQINTGFAFIYFISCLGGLVIGYMEGLSHDKAI